MISRHQIWFFVAISILIIGLGAQKLQIQPMAPAYSQNGLPPDANTQSPGHMGASPDVHSSTPTSPGDPFPQNQLPQDPNMPAPTNNMSTEANLPMPALLSNQEFIYDPTGKRDPFKAFITDFEEATAKQQAPFDPTKPVKDNIENYDLSQLKLVGVLWEVQDPKAMIQSPTGKVFLVKKQARIGRNKGFIGAIREGEIVVFELSQDGKTPSTRVLNLQK